MKFIIFLLIMSSTLFANEKTVDKLKLELTTVRLRFTASGEFEIPQITNEKVSAEIELFFTPQKRIEKQ